jgi:hypothetical protein
MLQHWQLGHSAPAACVPHCWACVDDDDMDKKTVATMVATASSALIVIS